MPEAYSIVDKIESLPAETDALLQEKSTSTKPYFLEATLLVKLAV
jgi:hypothetical protein